MVYSRLYENEGMAEVMTITSANKSANKYELFVCSLDIMTPEERRNIIV